MSGNVAPPPPPAAEPAPARPGREAAALSETDRADVDQALATALEPDDAVRAVVLRRVGPSWLDGGLYALAALAAVGLGVSTLRGVSWGFAPTLLLISVLAVVVGVVDRRSRRTIGYAVTRKRLYRLQRRRGGIEARSVDDAFLRHRRLDVRAGGPGRVRMRDARRRRTVLGPVDDVRAFDALLATLPGATAPPPFATAVPATDLRDTSGLRDADVRRIARSLQPGERVLWMGQPEVPWGDKQTLNAMQQRSSLLVLPLLAALGAVAAVAMALPGVGSWAGETLWPLVHLLGVLPALWMARELRRRSLYVVTDRRALVGLPSPLGYTVRSYEGAALTGAHVRKGGSFGVRSVLFGEDARGLDRRRRRDAPSEWAGPTGPGFDHLPDAEAVCELLRRVGAGTPPPGDVLALRLPQHAASLQTPPAPQRPDDGTGRAPAVLTLAATDDGDPFDSAGGAPEPRRSNRTGVREG